MEEKVSGEHIFNGGESFGRERVFVVVKGNSENMNDRGVWIQK